MVHGELKQTMNFNLIKKKDIINHIKGQRLSWFGHIYRITSDRVVKKNCMDGNRYIYRTSAKTKN
jgi:hypothetical protein